MPFCSSVASVLANRATSILSTSSPATGVASRRRCQAEQAQRHEHGEHPAPVAQEFACADRDACRQWQGLSHVLEHLRKLGHDVAQQDEDGDHGDADQHGRVDQRRLDRVLDLDVLVEMLGESLEHRFQRATGFTGAQQRPEFPGHVGDLLLCDLALGWPEAQAALLFFRSCLVDTYGDLVQGAKLPNDVLPALADEHAVTDTAARRRRFVAESHHADDSGVTRSTSSSVVIPVSTLRRQHCPAPAGAWRHSHAGFRGSRFGRRNRSDRSVGSHLAGTA